MFETDDYDQILSQFEFPEVTTSEITQHDVKSTKPNVNNIYENRNDSIQCNNELFTSEIEPVTNNKLNNYDQALRQCDAVNEQKFSSHSIVKRNKTNVPHHHNEIMNNDVHTKIITNKDTEKGSTYYKSPTHIKRKMINAYFDHKTKRKFPGPAGILTNCSENNKDETICQMELLSQDVDFTQNNLRSGLFECPLWVRLQGDLTDWNFRDIDSIKTIKQKTVTGNLRKKAHTVTAFVEAVDRSVIDPLVILRDKTGTIKGTLHRDAWSAFSQYIASEYCALILRKPTILITGAAYKKYYLNITLSNILAVYSSTVVNEEVEKKTLPEGYSIVYEDDYTVVKSLNCIQITDETTALGSIFENELPEDLDSMFSDDVF